MREGTLGRRRGRKPDPGMKRAVERLARAPVVLEEVLRADPELGRDPRIPTPRKLAKDILDGIVDAVDDEEVAWKGLVTTNRGEHEEWPVRVRKDAKSRASRLKQKERENPITSKPRDWLEATWAITEDDLCSPDDCPCSRLCKVKHLHVVDEEAHRGAPPGVPARPPRIVCLSKGCAINRYALSWTFGRTLHMHWPKRAEADLSRAEPANRWTSASDCPWHGVCDLAHERPADSEMVVFNESLHNAYPVECWCIDPSCKDHHVGVPHVHCEVCGAWMPFSVSKNEMNMATASRTGPIASGPLCDRHYFEILDRLRPLDRR